MIDPALPEFIEFSKMDYIAMSLEEAKNKNYEAFFFVNTTKSEQPRVILTTPTEQKIEILFGPTATIGIKEFKLYYNPTNVVNVNIESIPCKSSQDGKHQWQEKFSATNLKVLRCINCGHVRFLASPQLIKQWEEGGFIS